MAFAPPNPFVSTLKENFIATHQHQLKNVIFSYRSEDNTQKNDKKCDFHRFSSAFMSRSNTQIILMRELSCGIIIVIIWLHLLSNLIQKHFILYVLLLLLPFCATDDPNIRHHGQFFNGDVMIIQGEDCYKFFKYGQ